MYNFRHLITAVLQNDVIRYHDDRTTDHASWARGGTPQRKLSLRTLSRKTSYYYVLKVLMSSQSVG